MRNEDCTRLLAWALPQLGLRWAGFRRVKRQVCRRVGLRIRELGLATPDEYARYLERTPGEWEQLEALCGITISRFYRDAEVFDVLKQHVMPTLARALAPGETLHVWSAGCASGEEAYTIALIWELQVAAEAPDHQLHILATDRNPQLLERATRAHYRHSSLRELPRPWVDRAFNKLDELWCLDPALRRSVTFERADLRRSMPSGEFALILCRNLAFSYFELSEQRTILQQFIQRLSPGGVLVIGLNEQLPVQHDQLQRVSDCVYRKH